MASVLAVLDGARLPFDGGSSKLLYYMLERPEGCDVTIDHNTFEVDTAGTQRGIGTCPTLQRGS